MATVTKAKVTGNYVCVQNGKSLVCLQGMTGSVIAHTCGGGIAVMLIDGIRYHVPIDMIEVSSPSRGGVACG